MINQAEETNKHSNNMKQEVKEAEQKTKMWEENKHRLDKAISIACTCFVDEGIIEEMFPESKVTQLGKIEEYLHKKVAELEA